VLQAIRQNPEVLARCKAANVTRAAPRFFGVRSSLAFSWTYLPVYSKKEKGETQSTWAHAPRAKSSDERERKRAQGAPPKTSTPPISPKKSPKKRLIFFVFLNSPTRSAPKRNKTNQIKRDAKIWVIFF
jgi:hypothetical protein